MTRPKTASRILRQLGLLAGVIILGGVPQSGALTNVNVVTDFGATPGGTADDAPAFQAALNALKTKGGGILYIPSGNYMFNSRVQITNSAWQLTIQGAPGVNLYANTNNASGIFQFTHTVRDEQININDLTMIALREGAGTAIEVTSPPGGSQDKRVVTVCNVNIRGQVGGSQYFNKGMVITGLYRPLITDCSFSRTTGTDMSNTSSNFLPARGFDISDCYAPVLQNCSVSGADTAYYYVTSANSFPEDGAVIDSTADYCRTGIKFHQTDGVEPTFWVTGCDIKARDVGVWVSGRRICNITDNVFQQLSTAYPLKDVDLDNVRLGVVLRNTFTGALSGGRINILADTNCLDVIIRENTLSGAASNAVQLPANAAELRIECQP